MNVMNLTDTSKYATDFISKYEKYYFKETYEINDQLGIKGIKTTKLNDERIIVDKAESPLANC